MHLCMDSTHTQCSTNNNSYKHEFKPLTTDKFEYFVSSWYEELATLTRSSYFSLAFFVVHMFFRFRSICTREWKWTYGVGGGGGGDNGGATLFSIIILIINIVFIVDFQNMLHVISARCISSSAYVLGTLKYRKMLQNGDRKKYPKPLSSCACPINLKNSKEKSCF